jgi:hypothetical protein
MADEHRTYRLDDPNGLESAYSDLVTETAAGFVVRLPSEGNRTVVVPSKDQAAFIAEAEVLRQMLAA